MCEMTIQFQFNIRFICDNMQDKPQLTQPQLRVTRDLKSTYMYASSENVKGSSC